MLRVPILLPLPSWGCRQEGGGINNTAALLVRSCAPGTPGTLRSLVFRAPTPVCPPPSPSFQISDCEDLTYLPVHLHAVHATQLVHRAARRLDEEP